MIKKNSNILQKADFETILKNIPDPLIVCNESYEVIYVNNLFYSLYGSFSNEIIGMKLSDFLKNASNESCPICETKLGCYIPEDHFYHMANFSDSTGKEILVRLSHGVVEECKYYINIFSPMKDLVCIDKTQMDFVSTVSHELRTPMTSIKGFADTLLSAGDKLDKEQQVRFINIIKSQADRLTRLLENLLTVSRLETSKNKAVFKSLNLKYFIDRTIFSLISKYPSHKFNIDISKNLPNIWADQDKLEQVLTNLIDNAAKYSNPGSCVTVIASTHPSNNDKILIKFIDEGIGIPKEHLSKIFLKFSRIDNPLTRQVQGTGLGLYITKSLTESMGGTISLTSDNKGTIFSIVLDASSPEKQAQQTLIGE